jgi:hypothetical protein
MLCPPLKEKENVSYSLGLLGTSSEVTIIKIHNKMSCHKEE